MRMSDPPHDVRRPAAVKIGYRRVPRRGTSVPRRANRQITLDL